MNWKTICAIHLFALIGAEHALADTGPDLPLYQYVSPTDWAPDIAEPPGGYEFLSFAGYTWRNNDAVTHRVWLGNANGDRFMARTLPYCDGSAFGQVFECFRDIQIYLYDRSQLNVQPLYKCFDAGAGDTYISWFPHCQEPGRNGAPTGEGPYPYEAGRPDHFLGYTACKNAPFWWITNFDSYDSDGDGVYGDCDDDDDNDSIKDVDDNCPLAPNANQADKDGDGLGDVCDDSDNDGVFDHEDNCCEIPNPDQSDFNNNGIGNACENVDGDMFFDADDNCILIPNNDQRDTNADGIGNRCDADLNNDCVVNVEDLGRLRLHFFTSFEDADFNGDGVVNVIDLGIMRTFFFMPPGPSGRASNCN